MKQNHFLIENDDHWGVPLKGRSVSRFIVDYALTIQFLDIPGEEVDIRIAGEFHFKTGGKNHKLCPEQPTTLGPIFATLAHIVDYVRAFKDGRLEVQFIENEALIVMPCAKYEAWEIVGDRSLRIVCLPRGGLAVWQPESK
jgi:hypothetical protein